MQEQSNKEKYHENLLTMLSKAQFRNYSIEHFSEQYPKERLLTYVYPETGEVLIVEMDAYIEEIAITTRWTKPVTQQELCHKQVPWDFVERFYPDYHNCEQIAYHDDLMKAIDEEFAPGSTAEEIYNEVESYVESKNPARWEGDEEHFKELIHSELDDRLKVLNAYIYERAIINYLKENRV